MCAVMMIYHYLSDNLLCCLAAVSQKIASKVTLDALQLARARLARAECLADAGFPAEAASVLAAVLKGGDTPKTTGDYAGRRCHF